MIAEFLLDGSNSRAVFVSCLHPLSQLYHQGIHQGDSHIRIAGEIPCCGWSKKDQTGERKLLAMKDLKACGARQTQQNFPKSECQRTHSRSWVDLSRSKGLTKMSTDNAYLSNSQANRSQPPDLIDRPALACSGSRSAMHVMRHARTCVGAGLDEAATH